MQFSVYYKQVHNYITSLNDSKYLAGLCMIILNIGSKYITIELSKSQEDYIKNTIGRQMLLFSIAWMGTKDIYISLILTAVFIVLTQYLFNENSSLCILPEHIKLLYAQIDTNKDNKISDEELNQAIHILKKASKK
jgi:hypothetical protein